jgi:Tol biopolymer transport system component
MLIRADTGGDSGPERRTNVFLLTPGSDARRQITTGGGDFLPKWSHDRKLYTRETGPGTSDIWMVGADGSDPHRVLGDPQRDMDLTWSPDGRWFAFVRGELNRPTIVVARIDGSEETTLTSGNAREGHPSWY